MWYYLTEEGYGNIMKVIDQVSNNPTIRQYDNGTSCDVKKEATFEEAKTLRNIMEGAINSINFGTRTCAEVSMILNTAEFIALRFFPAREDGSRINGYDTIYTPLYRAWLENRVKED